MRQTKNQQIPLIFEDYPESYTGYPFITLVQYRKEDILAIVDNTSEKEIALYVLDLCKPETVNEDEVITVASFWFENNRNRFPVSVEFSRRDLSGTIGKIYRSFSLEFVTRVIGPAPCFNMTEIHSIKRRKKKKLLPGIILSETAENRCLSPDKFRKII